MHRVGILNVQLKRTFRLCNEICHVGCEYEFTLILLLVTDFLKWILSNAYN